MTLDYARNGRRAAVSPNAADPFRLRQSGQATTVALAFEQGGGHGGDVALEQCVCGLWREMVCAEAASMENDATKGPANAPPAAMAFSSARLLGDTRSRLPSESPWFT
jgi:hypothetical protein